jgi:hypothetical protein
MNQSDIRAMKQRLADRHGQVEACLDVNRWGDFLGHLLSALDFYSTLRP